MSHSIRLRTLLDFYDFAVPESIGHATAVNAVMGEDFAAQLFLHFAGGQGWDASVLTTRCTQGTRKGKRLDAWIRVSEQPATLIHYQTEIKNWSAHAIGGKKAPPLAASVDEMNAYRLNRWHNRFDDAKQVLKDASASKVLVPMAPLEEGVEVRPLIIFWDAMHPEGKSAEFFSVQVAHGHEFDRLWVFSMSTFIRNLLFDGVEEIVADMPHVHQRVGWFERMYASG